MQRSCSLHWALALSCQLAELQTKPNETIQTANAANRKNATETLNCHWAFDAVSRWFYISNKSEPTTNFRKSWVCVRCVRNVFAIPHSSRELQLGAVFHFLIFKIMFGKKAIHVDCPPSDSRNPHSASRNIWASNAHTRFWIRILFVCRFYGWFVFIFFHPAFAFLLVHLLPLAAFGHTFGM